MPENEFEKKLAKLQFVIEGYGSLLTAYSGGIDSTLIAVVARQVLGKTKGVAVIADSPSLPRYELEEAVAIAARHDIDLVVAKPGEMDDAGYVRNEGDRCYFCKSHLYESVEQVAEMRGTEWVANGTNLDDLGDYRPGLKAAEEAKVVSPLVEAGMDKRDVREIAKLVGIQSWDKPAAACLSSRIPYGVPVTKERLERVEGAERGLRSLGMRAFRVRHHEDVARVELNQDDLVRVVGDVDLRQRVIGVVKAAGYTYVSVDLEGFRSGSGNLVLTINQSE
ncbi:ATP-dependent sacrificial sulfur transferase LarE [Poriferisphaera corsica]|nr:ATP-dependent sacrificial sulfur transferase LarE [Poriferisphaera corsica]